jgi:uncharacterized membrane protein
MNRLLFTLPALALAAAGCATSSTPYAPVENVRYQGAGTEPFWLLAIGDDRIVLRIGDEDERQWPRTLPMRDGNVVRWRSDGSAGPILVESRSTPTPCELGNQSFQDVVRVMVGELRLEGCGGRLIRREDSR